MALAVNSLPTNSEMGVRSWVRKIPWRRAWQPTPVFLPGESHGQRSLLGYSVWGHRESDRTERLNSNNLTNLSDRKVPNFLRVRILRVQREIYRIKARKEKNCLKLSAITPGVPTGQVKAYQGTPMLQSHKNVRK